MEINATRQLLGRDRFRWTATTILSLLGVAAVGYIAVVPVEHAAPQMNEAAWFALDGQMVSSGTTTDRVDSQAATSVATATVLTDPAARRNFDYFPPHYVNRETKVEAVETPASILLCGGC